MEGNSFLHCIDWRWRNICFNQEENNWDPIFNTALEMAKVIVLEGQSLFDLAVQECGSIEAAFAIAELNGLAITDELEVGSTLIVPGPVARQISDYYQAHGLKPATDATSTGSGDGEGGGIDDLLDDGIDFMAIEVDNVVM